MLQIVFSTAVVSSFLLFSIYLFVRKRHYHSTFFLIGVVLFCVGVEIFDLLSLQQPEQLYFWKKYVLICEAFLPICFLSYAVFFAKRIGFKQLTFFQKTTFLLSLTFLPIPFFVPLEAIFFAPDFPQEKLIFLGNAGYFFYLGLLLYLVLALANLEKNFFSLPVPERYRVKFEIVGSGLIIAMLIVFYSQGLLYRTLNMALMLERSVILLIGVGLMFYSFARRGGLSRLYLSREMAYRSVVVMIVGVYFLILGLAGQGMRYLGESSQNLFFSFIAFLGALFVVVLLLSETMKRKLRVFLHKNFYQQKYDYRTQWLQFTNRMASIGDAIEMRRLILDLFCDIFSIHGAALFLTDGDNGKYICQAARELSVADRLIGSENSLVSELTGSDWVFSVKESSTLLDEEDRIFLRENGVSFIVPMNFEARLEGFIVLGRWINPNEKVIYEDYDLMKILARQAINSLMSQRLSEQLSTQREMAAIGRISTFVVHDLKNLVTSLGMMTENAREFIDEPEFQNDMLETLAGTVDRMKGLILRLRNFQEAGNVERIPCDLRTIAGECAKMANGSGVLVEGEPVCVEGDPDELQKVILNLIINAIEASGKDSPVQVLVGKDKEAFVRVIDQGCGLSEEFIKTRLFRPFETTKKKGFGIGLYQCRNTVEAHGGRIEVVSKMAKKTEFTVYLPLKEAQGQ